MPAERKALISRGSRPAGSDVFERRLAVVRLDRGQRLRPLAREPLADRRMPVGVEEPVSTPSGPGDVAAKKLVLTLGARLYPRQAVLDRVLDQPVVAAFEV